MDSMEHKGPQIAAKRSRKRFPLGSLASWGPRVDREEPRKTKTTRARDPKKLEAGRVIMILALLHSFGPPGFH